MPWRKIKKGRGIKSVSRNGVRQWQGEGHGRADLAEQWLLEEGERKQKGKRFLEEGAEGAKAPRQKQAWGVSGTAGRGVRPSTGQEVRAGTGRPGYPGAPVHVKKAGLHLIRWKPSEHFDQRQDTVHFTLTRGAALVFVKREKPWEGQAWGKTWTSVCTR